MVRIEGRSLYDQRRRIATWVGQEIIPAETRIRAWLSRSRLSHEDVDEVIQEAYCRLAMLEGVDHIDCPEAYFRSVVRNLMLRRLKRDQIVSIEAIAEIDAYRDDRPSPEDEVASRSDHARLLSILASLPERCRRIVELRKIEGWSQKRIAEHMGTTEKAVEKQVWLGVRTIRAAWSGGSERAAPARAKLPIAQKASR